MPQTQVQAVPTTQEQAVPQTQELAATQSRGLPDAPATSTDRGLFDPPMSAGPGYGGYGGDNYAYGIQHQQPNYGGYGAPPPAYGGYPQPPPPVQQNNYYSNQVLHQASADHLSAHTCHAA